MEQHTKFNDKIFIFLLSEWLKSEILENKKLSNFFFNLTIATKLTGQLRKNVRRLLLY